MRCLTAWTLCVAVMILFSGCDQGKSGPGAGKAKSNTAAAHSHDDDAGHSHAGEDKDGEAHHAGDDKDAEAHAAADSHSKVHGGHPISFGDAGFSAEWKHSSNNDIIDVYILNKEGTADMPIKAASITIRQATGENPESFELAAVGPNENGETAHFQRDDQRLNTAMSLGVVVEVTFNGETKTATIAAHQAHDH